MEPQAWLRQVNEAGLGAAGLRPHTLELGPGRRVQWWESRAAGAAQAGPTQAQTSARSAGGVSCVYLPGNGCSSLDVGPLGAALARRGRLVGIDPPGREPTLWPDEPLDFVDELPPLVGRIMDEAGVGPCVLVGHSMGAMLALQVARWEREARADDASARSAARPGPRVRALVMIEGFVAMEVHAKVVSPQGFAAVRMAGGLRQAWEARMAQDKAWLDRRPTFARKFWESQKTRHDARAWVDRLDLPILVFVGDLGQPMPPAEDLDAWRPHLGMDRVKDLEVCVVPRAGHWPMLDDPEHVTARVERWLARVAPAQAR